jgi:hypothetical protein
MASRVNRKLDIALLPFLSLLYLFNGLDRSNVGNAETQGMFFVRSIVRRQVFPGFPARLLIARTPKERILTFGNAGFTKDIGATPDDLNLAVSLFFITFVLLQPPSAAAGRWLGARHWITIMMVSSIQYSQHQCPLPLSVYK